MCRCVRERFLAQCEMDGARDMVRWSRIRSCALLLGCPIGLWLLAPGVHLIFFLVRTELQSVGLGCTSMVSWSQPSPAAKHAAFERKFRKGGTTGCGHLSYVRLRLRMSGVCFPPSHAIVVWVCVVNLVLHFADTHLSHLTPRKSPQDLTEDRPPAVLPWEEDNQSSVSRCSPYTVSSRRRLATNPRVTVVPKHAGQNETEADINTTNHHQPAHDRGFNNSSAHVLCTLGQNDPAKGNPAIGAPQTLLA